MTPGQQLVGRIRMAAAEARRQWPGSDDESKGWRAFKASLFVSELIAAGWRPIVARFWLAQPVGRATKEDPLGDRPVETVFNVSDRTIRRMLKVHAEPKILDEVQKGAVTPTTAAHLLEVGAHGRLGALRIAWLAASEQDRKQFERERGWQ